jgi:magnesium chelatase subunit D
VTADGAADARAVHAAALFAVDPAGLGGIVVRAGAGPARDAWFAAVRSLLPEDSPVRRVPLHVTDGRLLGGIDLPATLRAGRPIAERGLLADADGGVLVLAMAERMAPTTAAHLCAVLDTGVVALERDGLAVRAASRVGVVAFDEGLEPDERPPPALLERLAFWIALPPRGASAAFAPAASELVGDAGGHGPAGGGARAGAAASASAAAAEPAWPTRAAVAAARERLAQVRVDGATLEALCGVARTLGVDSLRVASLALRAARAAAALAGRDHVDADDATLAARLVFAPRARRVPDTPEQPDAPPPPPPPESHEGSGDTDVDATPPKELPPLEDLVLAAAQAAIPAGLLDALKIEALRGRARTSGQSGAVQRSGLRGRPGPSRRGEPRGGARLNVIETLRAAAPWQRIRRAQAGGGGARGPASAGAGADAHGGTNARAGTNPHAAANARARPAAARAVTRERVLVRVEDFHVTRHLARAETTTLFVVDASGSSALHRLAEAKGAVELLLADCYVRRDRVAVIAFRGQRADLLLPPTRSLVRAKRSLAGLPGGGGTPLASGLEAAAALLEGVQRRGGTPSIVLLTDGRANVARDGAPNRSRAEQDSLAAARRIRAARVAAVLVDTAPRPQPFARELATALGAHYLPLPHADAATLQRAVQAVSAA